MRAGGESDIGTGIDQNLGAVWPREFQDAAYQSAQVASAKVFFAHLNALDTVARRTLDAMQQRFDATRGAAVGNVVAQHSGGMVVALAGAGAAEDAPVTRDFALEVDTFAADLADNARGLETG